MKKISFVILNYNTEKEVLQCIDSIEKINTSEFKINYIVVDNHSDKLSLAMMKQKLEKYSNVDLLEMADNLGYSKANNEGYRYALVNFTPDYIGIINSDVKIVQKDFLHRIVKLHKKYEFSVLGPDIYVPHRRWHQNPSINCIQYDEKSVMDRIISLENELKDLIKKKESGISYNGKYSRRKELVRNVLTNIWSFITHTRNKKTYINIYLHGAALFFSKNYMEKYPERCFEPEVYMYGEEDLLKYKCNCNGDIMLYSPEVKVIHLSGTSFNKVVGNKNMIDRVIFDVKNEQISKKVLLDEIKKNEKKHMDVSR